MRTSVLFCVKSFVIFEIYGVSSRSGEGEGRA